MVFCKRSDAPLHRPGAGTRDRALRYTRAPPVHGAASRRRKAARLARRGGDQRPGSGSAHLRDFGRRRARHGAKNPRAASKGFVALGIASAVTHRSNGGSTGSSTWRRCARPPRRPGGALARPQSGLPSTASLAAAAGGNEDPAAPAPVQAPVLCPSTALPCPARTQKIRVRRAR
jgi:hypothetical protein